MPDTSVIVIPLHLYVGEDHEVTVSTAYMRKAKQK